MVWQLVREHPAATALVAIIISVTLALQVHTAVYVNDLHHNICQVVRTSAKGNTTQHQFWSDAENRARLRAAHEAPALRRIDLAAAQADHAIAMAYAPNPGITFPGC